MTKEKNYRRGFTSFLQKSLIKTAAKNNLKTLAGEASFSTLLFQDIAVIPILAILPLVANYKARHHDNEIQVLIQTLPEGMEFATVILGVGMLILLGRYVFVPFLRYVSKSGMTELLTASSLFLVIGVSELMVAIGLTKFGIVIVFLVKLFSKIVTINFFMSPHNRQ